MHLRYKCDRCRCLVRARKQVAVFDEPNALVVHLKRFNASPFSTQGGKIGRHVKFGLALDLQPFSSSRLQLEISDGSSPESRLEGREG